MNGNSSQFEINKKPNSKKLPWVKLCLASLSLLALVITSKNIFTATPATSGISLHPASAPAVLGDQILQNQIQTTATASSTPVATPIQNSTPTPTTAPVPSPVQSIVKIKNTPTGYLNVRIQPSLDSSVISKVYPGETYAYTTTQGGWYLIQLKSKHYGWVDGEYVTSNNK